MPARRLSSRLVFACCLLVPAWAGAVDKSGVAPQVLSVPSGPGSIEGLGASFEPQLNTGSAPYSVALAVPPGVNGAQPELSLSYNSGAGNGPVGLGWSLDLPLIQRQTDKGQPQYTASDVLVDWTGEELVPLADGTWRAENEQGFHRFRQLGEGWEVQDRSGRTLRLGQYPSPEEPLRLSRMGQQANAQGRRTPTTDVAFDETYQWLVDSVEDTNGNRIEYFYNGSADSPGELYVSEIRYNLHGSAGYSAVTFDYEARSDSYSDYRPGFQVRHAQRLARIGMWSAGAAVREYRLAYNEDPAVAEGAPVDSGVPLAMSILTSVTQIDRSGTGENYLPPIRFGYTRLYTEDQDRPPVDGGSTPFPGPEDVDLNGNGAIDGPSGQTLVGAPANVTFADGTASFLDVNGDALPDVFETKNGQHHWYRNLGGGRFEQVARQIAGQAGTLSLTSANVSLADADGDGHTDLVRLSPGSWIEAYGLSLNATTGDASWVPVAAKAVPGSLSFDLSDSRVRLLDLNFDKRTDLVRSAFGGTWTVCTQGTTAWQCGAVPTGLAWNLVFGADGLDRTQLADMNGDRIEDVIYLQEISPTQRAVSYAPGMERGLFDAQRATRLDGSANGVLDVGFGATAQNLQLLDVNGDGLSDLVRIENGVVRLWINLGGDVWSQPRAFVGTPTWGSTMPQLRTADVNGSGSTDIAYISTSGQYQFLDLAPSVKAHQLSLIDNGLGRRISIDYRSSTADYVAAGGPLRDDPAYPRPWDLVAPFPTQVVARVTVSPSLDLSGDGQPDRYVSEFVYRDAYYDGAEKEFRGFAFVKRIDRGDADAPTQVTRHFFHTGAPDGLDNDGDDATDERTEKGGAEEEALKGRVLRQEVTTAEGGADNGDNDGLPAPPAVTFSSTTSDWRIRPLHALDGGSRGIATLDERNISFAFNQEQVASLVELGSDTAEEVHQTFAYDDFGNPTEERHYGATSRTDDQRFTFRQFIHDTDRWIVDRVCEETVEDSAGLRTSQTRSYYDGAAFVGRPLCQQALDRGNLMRQEAWIEGGSYLQAARHAYDSFGNKIAIADGNWAAGSAGHVREIGWDPVFHTFPVNETIHVGGGLPPLVMTAAYDPGFGVMTESTDPNGNVTRYGYDSFGRLVSVTRPFDTLALPTERYEYELADPVRGELYLYDAAGALSLTPASARPSAVVTQKREESGLPGTLDSVAYVDGMGRPLAKVEEAEIGFVVNEVVQFNSRGTVRETLQPFESATDDWQIPLGIPRTLVRYDATGRELVSVNPPDAGGASSQRTTAYHPLVRVALDENNNEMLYRSDGLERLAEVEEVNLGQRYLTRYVYNPAGSLNTIVDAQGNVKTFNYDGLQRKVFLDDPNRGVLSYAYDNASNLVDSLDAKGQRILYDYDGVNRLVTEDYLDEGLPFSRNRSPDVIYVYDLPLGSVDLGDGIQATPANTRGFLTAVSDLSGEDHTSYDARGRVAWTVKRIADPTSGLLTAYKTEFAYDALDRVVERIYPDNDRATYTYNARGLLETIPGGPTGQIIRNLDYVASGQKEFCEYGNGTTTSYAYDPRFRMVGLETDSPTTPGQPVLSYGYTFDGASIIRRIDDLRPLSAVPLGDPRRNTQIFGYDDLYRLTGVQYSFAGPGQGDRNDGSIAYGYDRIGNMLSMTSGIVHLENGLSVTNLGAMSYGGTAGRSDRIGRAPGDPPGPHALTLATAGATTRPYSYDDNGNMTTLDGQTLAWDFKDRLVAVENATMRAEYRYDYTDRRIVKHVTPKPTAADPTPPSPATDLYIDSHFEVREDRGAVKYVFDGGTRVAQVTGTLDPSRPRLQRIPLLAGWNLVSLAISASNVRDQLVLGEPSGIDSAYRWNPATSDFVEVGAGESLDAGSVLWVRTSMAMGAAILGTYVEPGSVPIPFGSSLVPVPSALDLEQQLSPAIDRAWSFDASSQSWRILFRGALAYISDSLDRVAPGGALFVHAEEATELPPGSPAYGVRFYHQDHLGSTNAVTSALSTSLEEGSYYPFGDSRIHSPISPAISRVEPYRFNQKELDIESRLQFFEARYLTGALARFLSVDPLLDELPDRLRQRPQTMNAYSYSTNSPFSYRDPTGMETVGELIERRGVAAAAEGNAVEQAVWAFSQAYWDTFGMEDLSKVADPGKRERGEIGSAEVAKGVIDVLKVAPVTRFIPKVKLLPVGRLKSAIHGAAATAKKFVAPRYRKFVNELRDLAKGKIERKGLKLQWDAYKKSIDLGKSMPGQKTTETGLTPSTGGEPSRLDER